MSEHFKEWNVLKIWLFADAISCGIRIWSYICDEYAQSQTSLHGYSFHYQGNAGEYNTNMWIQRLRGCHMFQRTLIYLQHIEKEDEDYVG